MRTYLVWPTLFLGLVFGPSQEARADAKPEVLRLDNGLTVVLRKVKDAQGLGLTTLFPLGRDGDPTDGHGLAEMVVRVYATAAAGAAPARNPTELQGITRAGARHFAVAVERDHVAFRVLADKDGLAGALDEIAARLAQLKPTEEQFERVRRDFAEGRRPIQEWAATVAAEHAARRLSRGEPWDVDTVGSAESLARLRWDDVRAALASRCVPRGAFVAIAGDFEPGAVRALVKKVLGALAGGAAPAAPVAPAAPAAPSTPPAPAAPPTPAPKPADPVVVRVKKLAGAASPSANDSQGAWALRLSNASDTATLAPLLVLAARILESQRALKTPAGLLVSCYPIVEPGLLLLRAPLTQGQTPEAAALAMWPWFTIAARGAPTAKDVYAVRFWFNGALGLPLIEGSLAFDLPYVAYADARREMLGWDGAAILEAVKRVKEADLKKALEQGVLRGAVAVPGD